MGMEGAKGGEMGIEMGMQPEKSLDVVHLPHGGVQKLALLLICLAS
jgi:hypothetical protein